MGYSGAGGKLTHEKNQKQKISWHCPFKFFPYPVPANGPSKACKKISYFKCTYYKVRFRPGF